MGHASIAKKFIVTDGPVVAKCLASDRSPQKTATSLLFRIQFANCDSPSPRCARPSPAATAGEGGAPRCALMVAMGSRLVVSHVANGLPRIERKLRSGAPTLHGRRSCGFEDVETRPTPPSR
jgi:hypothetical protein